MENLIQEYIGPFSLLFLAPVLIYFLLCLQFLYSNDIQLFKSFDKRYIFGSNYSWLVVIIYIVFQYVCTINLPTSIKNDITDEFHANGTTYYDNGLTHFAVSVILFSILLFVIDSDRLYNNIPYIVCTFNIIAFILCTYLYASSNKKTDNIVKDFFAGTENHVRIADVDVKQFINCRLAMIGWSLLILLYLKTEYNRYHTISTGSMVCAVLQLVYIAKFFWWETGYFNTIDIMHDMCGYYVLWGCLVFFPVIYTVTQAYLVNHPNQLSTKTSMSILALGLVSIFMNYYVDYEKEQFKKNPTTEKFLPVIIRDDNGQTRESKLLISGTWSQARHLNYTFELLSALAWTITALNVSDLKISRDIYPFVYFIYLFILLMHRLYRDEIRCSNKYGPYWSEYKRLVPSSLIPGVI